MGLEKAGVDQSGNIDRTNDDTAVVYCPLDSEKLTTRFSYQKMFQPV